MQAVGALGVVGGSQLTNLQGFKLLTQINGSLTVAFNPRLKNLYGLGPEGTGEGTVGTDSV